MKRFVNKERMGVTKKSEYAFDIFALCDSEAIRTLDPRLRRALLYPAELRNHPQIAVQNYKF